MGRRSITREVVVVGGGPSGMTAALLLARAGHRVTILERAHELGGLWSCALDEHGRYLGENSCKVYQSSYQTTPALFEMLGLSWEDHFTQRHDLATDWLRPFVADASLRDLARLTTSFAAHAAGARDYRDVSVADYLERHGMGERCRAWMRATALGGVTGTLRMTMWELFHRLESNVGAILHGGGGALHWNARPPNAEGGFVTAWATTLARVGVRVVTSFEASRLEQAERGRARVIAIDGTAHEGDAVFLAVPPPALAALLSSSPDEIARGFGDTRDALAAKVRASQYAHLGLTWHFDRALPRELPLGGHNVRRGWHPILVQHAQYAPYLRPGITTVVVGSVSLDTTLRHPRLDTLAASYAPRELAAILWDDERRVDPSLPEPVDCVVHGVTSATQILESGPLPIRARGAPVFVATSLNGAAPYFTASLESAIQAGAAAAAAFEPHVERLPTQPDTRRSRARPRAMAPA